MGVAQCPAADARRYYAELGQPDRRLTKLGSVDWTSMDRSESVGSTGHYLRNASEDSGSTSNKHVGDRGDGYENPLQVPAGGDSDGPEMAFLGGAGAGDEPLFAPGLGEGVFAPMQGTIQLPTVAGIDDDDSPYAQLDDDAQVDNGAMALARKTSELELRRRSNIQEQEARQHTHGRQRARSSFKAAEDKVASSTKTVSPFV